MTAILPVDITSTRAPSRLGEAVVRVEGLTKRFAVQRRWREIVRHPRARPVAVALHDVSFEVRRGEFFGLLGPNGAGKTTLFKVLSTLVLPDEGRVTVEGMDVVRDDAGVRRILTPVTPEERSLSWRLSARENLNIFAALHNLRGQARRRRVDEVLERTELADTGEKLVGQFSSGMRQRLLLARALLSRPHVLLLDEPTRSLDPVSARRFRAFLREEIVGRAQCTVLIATHNSEEALELCDRLAVLDRGVLRALGTAAELSSRASEAQYRIRTRAAWRPAIDVLVRRGMIRRVLSAEFDEDGWYAMTLDVPGGAEDAAAVVACLTDAGAPVAGFERVRLSLADLIERLVNRGRHEVEHG
ncbi:MAG TPA: ABC transporter ATP-binding protein [Gemmatimonadaceae bacterium]|nr:ABC transporter ATP-binding protein [Gemmatimonadaceae bacterium]